MRLLSHVDFNQSNLYTYSIWSERVDCYVYWIQIHYVIFVGMVGDVHYIPIYIILHYFMQLVISHFFLSLSLSISFFCSMQLKVDRIYD